MLVSNTVPISRPRNYAKYPIKFLSRPKDFSVSTVQSRPRDNAKYPRVPEHMAEWGIPFESRKTRITKNFKKENSQKLKQKKFAAPVPIPMPREDPPRSPIKTWCYRRQKGHGLVLCYRGKKEMRLLTLYYSQFTEETSQEQGKKKKGSKTVRSQDKPFVCRRERVKINRNCSRTF